LAALAAGNRTARAADAGKVEGDFAGLIDIGGRSLYMESHGSGGPTVVLEAGGLARGDVWSRDNLEPEGKRTMVLPAIAELTRVIVYDRPGTIGELNPELLPSAPLFYPSRSDPVPQPRTARDVVADLHALLTAAAIPGPYVFAGHSLGGLCARLYTSTYPDEVVGMVLIDATHEDVWVEFKQALTAEQWAIFEEISTENAELLAAYPEAEQLTPAPLDETPTTVQMREAQIDSPLRPMPLVVLSHGIPFAAPFPGWPSDEMEQIMLALQSDLARLVPDARHVIARESGHNIHQDQPELVIEAIRQVVEAVRDPSSWALSTPISTPGDTADVHAFRMGPGVKGFTASRQPRASNHKRSSNRPVDRYPTKEEYR
jgi:pimeloyl-ACP methyl ester carboxylesterase